MSSTGASAGSTLNEFECLPLQAAEPDAHREVPTRYVRHGRNGETYDITDPRQRSQAA